MKKVYLFVAMGMIASVMTLNSCSSDEENIVVEQPVQPTEPQTTLVDVVDQVKTRSTVDYSDLEPLAAAVRSKAEDADDTSNIKMLLRLLKLLDFLQPENVTQEGEKYHYQWNYSSLNDALKLTIDALLALDPQTGNPVSRIITDQIVINAVDGTVYTINGKIQISLLGTPTQYILEIYKGEEILLAGYAESVWPVGVGEEMVSGTLNFKGNEFTLSQIYDGNLTSTRTITYKQNGEQLAVIKLKVDNNYSFEKMLLGKVRFTGDLEVNLMDNLAVVKSHIKSLNRYYLDAAELTKVSKEGTSKENCQIICDGFNNNTTTTLLVAGVNAGTLTLAPTQSDVVRNLYKPTIMASSPLIGDREMTLEEIMEAMGVSLEDIINMLLGSQE